MGRKTKPTIFHMLDGNPSHLTKEEILQKQNVESKALNFKNGEVPKAPTWIRRNKYSKSEWNRIVPLLSQMKILTKTDLSALEAYCKCWGKYREAEDELDNMKSQYYTTEKGSYQQVPQFKTSQQYLGLCKQFMSEFGLTPSSRGAMKLPGEKDDEDRMESLMKEAGY